ncbi:MAG TPA: YggT family protein [Patescibacteria group bacterium]|nr:YggT family protein [Patescibacteria group bacterium]
MRHYRSVFLREYLISGLFNGIITLIEVFLSLRFVLKLFSANPQTPFVAWVYDTSQPLLKPFQGIFPSPVIEEGYVLEFTTLFALLVYAIFAWLLFDLVLFLKELLTNLEVRAAKHNGEEKE